jgi:methionyl-tRNA synthetase
MFNNHQYVLNAGTFVPLLLIVVIWSLIWKGLALWRAARSEQTVWFWILLLVNTVGILEIIYLAFFAKKEK